MNKNKLILLLSYAMVVLLLPMQAQAAEITAEEKELIAIDKEVSESSSDQENAVIEANDGTLKNGEETTPATASPDLSGFGFGMGIGINTLSNTNVDKAKIVNNVVHVESKSNVKTQFWLEAHYSFGRQYSTYECTVKQCLVYDIEEKKLKKINKGDVYFRPKRFFHGPFFALNMGESESVINGAALGYMLSWRKIDAQENPTGSFFNLGIGISSTRIQELGGGLKDGQTVSTGTQIEYKSTDDTGMLMLFSVGL